MTAALDIGTVKRVLSAKLDAGLSEADICRRLGATEPELEAVLAGTASPSPTLAERLAFVDLFGDLPAEGPREDGPTGAAVSTPATAATGPSMLDRALALAARGFHVFPLHRSGKRPAIKEYPERATRDPEQIKAWWTRWPQANIGISTTRFGDNEALAVIDEDNKKGKDGAGELFKLELSGLEIPRTYTQQTPTGGRHHVFRCPEPVKQGVNVLAPGLDVRGRGGYIVAAGSAVGGGVYTGDDAPVAPAPQWLIDRCGRAMEREPNAAEPITVNPVRAREQAIHYLKHDAPIAIEGQGGNSVAYQVACKVKDYGVPKELCLSLMLDHWNDRCAPPWSPEELWTIVENAFRYGRERPGSGAVEAHFGSVPTTGDAANDDKRLHPFDELNKRYATVNEHGVPMVYCWRPIPNSRQFRVERSTHDQFAKLFRHKTIASGDGKTIKIGAAWLDHPSHRHYDEIVFAPGSDVPPGALNLWQGFTVDPKPGDWSLLRDHIEKIVCEGDPVRYEYAIRWLAWKVQNPGGRPEVAFVMRGGKGVGKGTLTKWFGRLFGVHRLSIKNAEEILGSFNEHLNHCVLLCCEEAFFPADPRQDGPLKFMITEEEFLIHFKFGARVPIPNRMAIMMSSNSDAVVPASGRERRYFVTDVSDARIQDLDYFGAIDRQMKAGGLAAMLYDLQRMDLSGFNIRAVPQTEALTDQKRQAAKGVEGWLWGVLEDGDIASDFSDGPGWPEKIGVNHAYDLYKRYAKERGERSVLPSQLFGRKLRDLIPSIGTQRPRDGAQQIRVYTLPPLEQCRDAFARSMHLGKYEWGKMDGEDEGAA